jgi:translation elongation factor EF-Tu-like GTPase
MAIHSSADVWVDFRTAAQGGRVFPAFLGDGKYRPHFRVAGGEYLGVAFVGLPESLVQPGAGCMATVSFMYEPGVDYTALVEGAQFEVLEGARVVATGRVIHRRSMQAAA